MIDTLREIPEKVAGKAYISLKFHSGRLDIVKQHLENSGHKVYEVVDLDESTEIRIRDKDVVSVSAIREAIAKADEEANLVAARDFLKKDLT